MVRPDNGAVRLRLANVSYTNKNGYRGGKEGGIHRECVCVCTAYPVNGVVRL